MKVNNREYPVLVNHRGTGFIGFRLVDRADFATKTRVKRQPFARQYCYCPSTLG
jgi:hypothetical protein